MGSTVSFKLEDCGNKILKLGSGSYGEVFLYSGGKFNNKIAVKKMKLDDGFILDAYIKESLLLRSVSGKGWQNKMLYKYKSKKCLQSHPNIITILSAFFEDNYFYIVMPYFGSNLKEYIVSENRVRGFTKEIIYQIISAIAYLHGFGIIHRDLTPSNILLVNGIVKLIDFSLSKRRLDQLENTKNTPELCSLWYRSPELLFGSVEYDNKSDVWSIGCILAELVLGKALFNLNSEEGMVCRLIDTFGFIQRDYYEDKELAKWNLYEKNYKEHVRDYNYSFDNRLNPEKYNDIPTGESNQDATFLLDNEYCFDLLKKLLHINPKIRISSQEALEHYFISEVRNKNYEKVFSVKEQLNERLPLFNVEDNFTHVNDFMIYLRSKCLYRMMELMFDLDFHKNAFFLLVIIFNRYMLEFLGKVNNSTIYKLTLTILGITTKMYDLNYFDLEKICKLLKIKYDEKYFYQLEKDILNDLSFDIDYSTLYDYLHLKCEKEHLDQALEVGAYVSTTQLGFFRPDQLADYVISQVRDPNSEWMQLVYGEHDSSDEDDAFDDDKPFETVIM